VEDAWFCDRDSELRTLADRMSDGIHVILLSPRRYGKTSLVHAALRRFRAAGGRAGYADLIRATSEHEVAAEILSATVNGVLRRPRRAARSLEDVIARLRVTPSVSVTPEGRVSFAFEPALARRAWQQILDDALDLLADSAREGRVALALDEFQQVAEIGIGGAFKAAADRLTNVSLVFCGSHQSVMERLTRTRGAPLYGMGEVLTLDTVPLPQMADYLRRRARAGGKRMAKVSAELLFERAGGIPNDVQWLAHAAYEHASDDAIDEQSIEAGLAAIVARQSSSFAERFEALAPSQQRTLKALAESTTEHPYSRSFLERVEVANANAVRKALAALVRGELVEHSGAKWRLSNPFLRAWLLN
jgi:AAA+ ATPase superfamily predicted ATPase